MVMKLQKLLVASKLNNFHPYALRPFGLTLVVAALVLVNVTYNLTAMHHYQVLGYATNISADQIVSLTNQQRANNGLGSYANNAQLTQAAQAKASDMFAKDYWSHYAPDGTSPWFFITSSGYDFATAGENLAKDFDTSDGTVTGWMNSPAHRDNILSTAFQDVGVAVLNGTLQGSPTTLVVAMYGASRVAASASVAPVTTTAPPPAKSAPAPPAAASPLASADTPPEPPAPAPAATSNQQQQVVVKAKQQPVTPNTLATQSIDYRTVRVRESRNWAQNASLSILSFIFLINIMKHTIVWRTQRRGWRHIWLRAHPAAQYGLLLTALVANLISSAGVIR